MAKATKTEKTETGKKNRPRKLEVRVRRAMGFAADQVTTVNLLAMQLPEEPAVAESIKAGLQSRGFSVEPFGDAGTIIVSDAK